jgi:hypothetical protein
MTKKIKTKKTTKRATAAPNVGIEITDKAATNLFVNSLKRKNTGENSHVEDFLFVVNYLSKNFGCTFTYSQLVAASKHLDLPNDELENLFEKWSDVMWRLGRLQIVEGAYDERVYVFC